MVVDPEHGRSDETFTATYTLKGVECPAGKPVEFTWQSARHQSQLGTSALQQRGSACTSSLTTAPPIYDRAPGAYTVCGNYRTPDEQSIVDCADYRVDPGGPPNSPSPTTGTGPGGTGVGPGGTGGTGGPGGTLGTGPGGSLLPGETGSPNAAGSPDGTPPSTPSGVRTAFLAVIVVATFVTFGAVYARSVLKS